MIVLLGVWHNKVSTRVKFFCFENNSGGLVTGPKTQSARDFR